MVTAINASGISGMQTGTAVNAKTVVQDQKAEESEQTTEEEKAYATSTDGDTLNLSTTAAKRAKTFTAQSKQGTTTSDEGYTDSTAMALQQAASNVGIDSNTQLKNEMSASSAAVSGSSSSSSSSTNSSLSSYSETELKEMLRNGEITQAEYNEEIESRESDTSDSTDSTDAAEAENQNLENVEIQ